MAYFGDIGTGFFEGFFDKIGCGKDVILKLGISTDRRDAEKVQKFVEKAVFVFFDKCSCRHIWVIELVKASKLFHSLGFA